MLVIIVVTIAILLIIFKDTLFGAKTSVRSNALVLKKDKNLLTAVEQAVNDIDARKTEFRKIESVGAAIVEKNDLTNKSSVCKRHNRYKDISRLPFIITVN